ncbi:unnamed protein product, partial [Laminaria digitata]
MSKTLVINSIHEAHKLLGLNKPKHPLVSVFKAKHYEGAQVFKDVKVVIGLYRIVLKSSS